MVLNKVTMEISKANKEDFAYIKGKLKKYLLDATDIDWRQFFVVRLKNKIVAFGRIIDRGDCLEIASVGVDYYHRRKGIGKRLVNYLLEIAKEIDGKKPIYAVTHLPKFAQSCGFVQIQDNCPSSLEYKRKHLCRLDESKIKIMRWMGV